MYAFHTYLWRAATAALKEVKRVWAGKEKETIFQFYNPIFWIHLAVYKQKVNVKLCLDLWKSGIQICPWITSIFLNSHGTHLPQRRNCLLSCHRLISQILDYLIDAIKISAHEGENHDNCIQACKELSGDTTISLWEVCRSSQMHLISAFERSGLISQNQPVKWILTKSSKSAVTYDILEHTIKSCTELLCIFEGAIIQLMNKKKAINFFAL